jgi:hypothetical protein
MGLPPAVTGSSDDDPEGPQLERLRTGGASRATAVLVLIATTIGILVWRPWTTAPAAPIPEASTRGAVAQAPNSTEAAPTASPPPLTVPSDLLVVPGVDISTSYISLVDNEWTVVALLSPGTTATDEPATPHAPLTPWSADGPFLVLQQGAAASAKPLERLDGPAGTCSTELPPRFRPAVHVPAGRVAYLGVTYPGMDPRARVTATVLGSSGVSLRRASQVVVRLVGLPTGDVFTIPTSGLGGTMLFATSQPGFLPTDTYRFDVALPGAAGHRYLYACVGT